MIAEDFCFNMTLKYNAGQKNEKAKKRNELFMSDLLTFTDVCPEKYLKEVYDYVSREKKDNYIPPMKLLYAFAEEREYIPKKVFKRKSTPYWYKCKNCGKEYGSRGRSCPVCGFYGGYLYARQDKTIPNRIELVQTDCSICSIYPKRNEDRSYVFGPDCNSFGNGKTPFDQCSDCSCKPCCFQYAEMIQDRERFKIKVKSNKIKMPWIDMVKQSPKKVNSVRELAEAKIEKENKEWD